MRVPSARPLLSATATLCAASLCAAARDVAADTTAAAPAAAAPSPAAVSADPVAAVTAGVQSLLHTLQSQLGVNAALWLLPLSLLLVWCLFSVAGGGKKRRAAKVAAAGSASNSNSSDEAPYPAVSVPQTQARVSASHETDVVIIGAGVGGASLGAALGKRGYRVVVLEQSLEEPHRIVGELLQPSGVQILRDIGLPGQQTHTLRPTGSQVCARLRSRFDLRLSHCHIFCLA
jgi:hypothetical protein